MILEKFSAFNLEYMNQLYWNFNKEKMIKEIKSFLKKNSDNVYIFTDSEEKTAMFEIESMLNDWKNLTFDKLNIKKEMSIPEIMVYEPNDIFQLSPMAIKYLASHLATQINIDDNSNEYIQDLMDYMFGE